MLCHEKWSQKCVISIGWYKYGGYCEYLTIVFKNNIVSEIC